MKCLTPSLCLLFTLLFLLPIACTEPGDEELTSAIGSNNADVSVDELAACLAPDNLTEIDYSTQVDPIFQNNGCAAQGCHGGSSAFSFDINTMPGTLPNGIIAGGPLVIPCKPLESPFFITIAGGCPDQTGPISRKMPPSSPTGLNIDETQIVQQWIAEGARPTFEAGVCP